MQNYTSMHKKAEITKLLKPVLRFECCEFIIFRALPIFMDFIDRISNHEIKNNICTDYRQGSTYTRNFPFFPQTMKIVIHKFKRVQSRL